MPPLRRYVAAALHVPGRPLPSKLMPTSTRCTLRFNATSTADLTIPTVHPVIADAIADGTRATVWLVDETPAATLTKTRLLEGPVGEPVGAGPFGAVTIPIQDDIVQLHGMLAWPNPNEPVTGQVDDVARYEGPAETRALAALADNVDRLDLPWDIPASLGRGPGGITEIRLVPLADQILPILTAARLQLVVERNPSTGRWDVEVREGDTLDRPLEPRTGLLTSWRWKRTPPTATRAVVLGAGTGPSQERALVVDATREATLGRVIEIVVDARDAELGANLAARGTAALAAAAGGVTLEATLRESTWFAFPQAYGVGTRIRVAAGGVAVEDVITEIEIVHDARGGVKITPRIGFGATDPQEQLAASIGGMQAALRHIGSL